MRVYFDGNCPICSREIAWLEQRPHSRNVEFLDIADVVRSGAIPAGLTEEDLMGRIHAIDDAGNVSVGMDALREVYLRCGLRWVARMSRLPGLKQAADAGYGVFARNRMAIGRFLERLGRGSVRHVLILAMGVLAAGCETGGKLPELQAVPQLDLDRYMGRWYVIANIPTFVEKGAHNAIEDYALRPDGIIDITFTFRADGFDGDEKAYHPRARVVDSVSRSKWEVQFLWPFWADYLVIDLAPDYSWVVVGVPSRSYVWIMARRPVMDEATYADVVARLRKVHYDTALLQLVPQKW
jgi:apolipoprotein D and lipocalin family protein